MFDTILDSAKLFLQGKLFQNTGQAVRLLFLGALLSAASTVVAGIFLPLWVAALIGGVAGGLAQPWLYRNTKYA